MNFGYIDQAHQLEWEKLVAETPESGFMQTFFWADFKRQTGWETFKIGIFEDKKLIGGAIIMKYYFGNTSFLYIPEGPVINYADDQSKNIFKAFIREIDKLVTFWGKHPTTHLRIEPRLDKLPAYFKDFVKAPYNLEPKQTLMIDLNLKEEEILASMKPKGRYNIKVAERFGIEIKSDDSTSALPTFLNIYRQTKSRNSFKGKEDWYFESLAPLLPSSKKGQFYTASYQGKILAVALVIFFGERVSYFFGGSTDTDKEKMAPYLLHFEIMKEAKSKGYRFYDLWGIAEKEDDETNTWHGFSKFKRQFGGKRFDFIGTYDLVYNKKLYEKFLKESGEV